MKLTDRRILFKALEPLYDIQRGQWAVFRATRAKVQDRTRGESSFHGPKAPWATGMNAVHFLQCWQGQMRFAGAGQVMASVTIINSRRLLAYNEGSISLSGMLKHT